MILLGFLNSRASRGRQIDDFGITLVSQVHVGVAADVGPECFHPVDEVGQILGPEVAIVLLVGARAPVTRRCLDLRLGHSASVHLGAGGVAQRVRRADPDQLGLWIGVEKGPR
ncbi:hypothetical protein ACH0BU_02570 [Sphingomonas olei]